MFTLEDYYDCSRDEYCSMTGITYNDLVRHLEAEILMLERSKAKHRALLIGSSEHITSETQRRRSQLIGYIQTKIDNKKFKIRDIQSKIG